MKRQFKSILLKRLNKTLFLRYLKNQSNRKIRKVGIRKKSRFLIMLVN